MTNGLQVEPGEIDQLLAVALSPSRTAPSLTRINNATPCDSGNNSPSGMATRSRRVIAFQFTVLELVADGNHVLSSWLVALRGTEKKKRLAKWTGVVVNYNSEDECAFRDSTKTSFKSPGIAHGSSRGIGRISS